MAWHRVGNKFLSQSEYDDDEDAKWMLGLFLAGTIVTGFLLHHYLVNPEWYKAIRATVTVVPALGIGVLLAMLRHIVRILLLIAFILAVVAIIIGVISSLI